MVNFKMRESFPYFFFIHSILSSLELQALKQSIFTGFKLPSFFFSSLPQKQNPGDYVSMRILAISRSIFFSKCGLLL